MRIRRLVLAFAAVALGAAAAQSASATESTGCGVGTMIFEGQKGVIPAVLAVTTNGLFGNQTFGISTGTLGCEQDAVIQAEHRVNMFAGSNLDALAHDMAQGGGETLEAFAELLEVPTADRPAFYALTQRNFARIFPDDAVTAGAMLENLSTVMAEARTQG